MTGVAEQQYLDLVKRILKEGEWVENERTGKRCLTVINADFEYPADEFPLITTRQGFWKGAMGEMIGYLRGYTDASKFAELKSPTWFANANENEAWLKNPNRKGEHDMGAVYGYVAKNWPDDHEGVIDTIEKVIRDLSNGIDDRGEIISFWNPSMFHKGCLRPCMYEHIFSLIGRNLYVNSTQR